jgi:hypothetical protein
LVNRRIKYRMLDTVSLSETMWNRQRQIQRERLSETFTISLLRLSHHRTTLIAKRPHLQLFLMLVVPVAASGRMPK